MEYNFRNAAIRWPNIKNYKRHLLHFFEFCQETTCVNETRTQTDTQTHTNRHADTNKQTQRNGQGHGYRRNRRFA